ncbi:YcgL domain-containing protein [Dokdonella sp.]|uniref:YcgL domain-containing protein n=1 Tax=Dokdonella sp. TaxID=2291710 RepID=UPI001B103060|nr:YcgL domain-containing protein [Dokdonella sp.]MBO9664494.1 YcgL domain-containing protein [Dokdonella sp.]
MTIPATTCYVYKSLRKADTYVYLRARDDFAALPAELAQALGKLVFVLQLELTSERKLAREEASVVLEHLAERGFHLQMPPTDPLE